MFPCNECNKTFSTKHSLSSHRSKFHKSGTDTTSKIDTDIDNIDDSVQSKSSVIDQLVHGSDDSEVEADDEAEINGKAELDDTENSSSEGSTDKSGSDSDTKGSYAKNIGKSKRKQFRQRSRPYQTKGYTTQIQQSDIAQINKKLDKLLMGANSFDKKDININKSIHHPNLFKGLCRGILDGSLPLSTTHMSALKRESYKVRKLAYGKVGDRKKLLKREVDRHTKTGGSILKTILDGVIMILPILFN